MNQTRPQTRNHRKSFLVESTKITRWPKFSCKELDFYSLSPASLNCILDSHTVDSKPWGQGKDRDR